MIGRCLKLILFLNGVIKLVNCIDNDLHALIVSGSHLFENFRHSINPLLIYKSIIRNNIPDKNIVLGLSEYHACFPQNVYPGKLNFIHNNDNLISCDENINIDYKSSDFTNFKFLDIIKGRSSNMLNSFRDLKSDKKSRVLFSISAHGGETFIKFRGKTVVLSEELNRALKEMSIKRKFKEMLFIVDTCEGLSLWDNVEVEGIYFVSSSKKDQKASSTDYNWDFMGPLADKFHSLFFRKMNNIHNSKNFGFEMNKYFSDMKKERSYLDSDISIIDRLGRNITFSEFFGNPHSAKNKNENLIKDREKMKTFESSFIKFFQSTKQNLFSKNINQVLSSNEHILDKFFSLENELQKIKNYEESTYHLGSESISNDSNFLIELMEYAKILVFDFKLISIAILIFCLILIWMK